MSKDVQFKLVVTDAGTPSLRAFGSEASRVLGLEKDLAVAGKSIGREVAAGMAQATPPVVRLGRETEVVGGKVRDVGGRFAKMGADTEQALGAASRSVLGLGRAGGAALGQMGSAAQVALGVFTGGALVGGIEAVAGGIRSVAVAGMEFGSQVSDLSAITGIAGDDLARLRDAGIDLSVGMGRSADDVMTAFKLLASQLDMDTAGGVEGLQRLGAETVTLAASSRITLETAANAIAGTLNQYGLAASESTRVMEAMAAGAVKGSAEVEDLSASMAQAGAVAASANVSLEETIGALEVLGKNATRGAEAGTALRNVILILRTEQEKLADAGVRVNLEQDGLTATLAKLRPILGNASAMTEIFGRENVTAATYLVQNADSVRDLTDAVTGTTAATDAAATQTDNLRGDVDRLASAMTALALDSGSGFNDVLRDTVQATRDLAVWLRENWDSVETGTKLIALGALAYGAYSSAATLSAAATAAHGIATTAAGMAALAMAGETGVATLAMRAFSAAVMANPLGLLLGALAAVVGAWLLFGDAAERAAGRTEAAMNRVRTAAERAKAAILSMNAAEATAARADADGDKADALARMNDLYRQILERRRALGALDGRLASDNPIAASTAGREADTIRGTIAELESALQIARSEFEAAGEMATTAQQRLQALSPAIATPPTPPAGAPAGTSATAAAGGETPAQRTARLEREAESTRQAALDLAQTQRDITVSEAADREEAARHRRAMRVQDLRETHADNAERIALMTDEFARRRAALSNDSNLAETARQVEIDGIKAEAQAAEDAAQAKLTAALAAIDGERAAKERNADETARAQLAQDEFDMARDAARNRRDEEIGRAGLEKRQEARDADAEARQIDADELTRDLARIKETADAEDAAVEHAKRAKREYEQEQEQAHERQMERLQKQADTVLAGIGLASQLTSNAYARREAEAQAEDEAATRRREGFQAGEAAALAERQAARLRVIESEMDAEGLSAERRAELEEERRTMDAESDALKDRQAAENEAADLARRRKMAQLDRSAAIAERRAILFRIAIETALNLVEVFPDPFKMAAAGALGLMQGAAVAGQPLPAIPQYALGTDRAPGGMALVGERGPELVQLPGGSSVITNERTERLGAAMRAVERSQAGRGAPSVVVRMAADPAHAAALDALQRETAGQTVRIEAALGSVEAAVRAQDLRIDGLELSRGLKQIDARESAAGNTRPR
jgi:TP901 family phage tail tape measure protein